MKKAVRHTIKLDSAGMGSVEFARPTFINIVDFSELQLFRIVVGLFTVYDYSLGKLRLGPYDRIPPGIRVEIWGHHASGAEGRQVILECEEEETWGLDSPQ